MSAAHPLSASATEQKPREPSMEEILASIRRIIADDQSLPGRVIVPATSTVQSPEPPVDGPVATDPDGEPSARYREGSPVAEVSVPPEAPRGPEPLTSSGTEGHRSMTSDAMVDPARQHGTIAAPQFAMPHGPLEDTDHFEELGRAETEPSPFRLAVEASPATVPPTPVPTESRNPEHNLEEDEELFEALDDPEPDEASGLFSAATYTSVQSAFNMLAATRLADNSEELKSMVREMIRPLLRSWLDDNLPSMVERMVRAEIERVARGGR